MHAKPETNGAQQVGRHGLTTNQRDWLDQVSDAVRAAETLSNTPRFRCNAVLQTHLSPTVTHNSAEGVAVYREWSTATAS